MSCHSLGPDVCMSHSQFPHSTDSLAGPRLSWKCRDVQRKQINIPRNDLHWTRDGRFPQNILRCRAVDGRNGSEDSASLLARSAHVDWDELSELLTGFFDAATDPESVGIKVDEAVFISSNLARTVSICFWISWTEDSNAATAVLIAGAVTGGSEHGIVGSRDRLTAV